MTSDERADQIIQFIKLEKNLWTEQLYVVIQEQIQKAIEAERAGCATQLDNAAKIIQQKGNDSEASFIRGLAQSLRDRK